MNALKLSNREELDFRAGVSASSVLNCVRVELCVEFVGLDSCRTCTSLKMGGPPTWVGLGGVSVARAPGWPGMQQMGQFLRQRCRSG